MSRRITIIGLAALCALALAAVGASGASAAENTAFTCVPVAAGTGEFVDSGCTTTTPGTKSWKHEAIANGTSTGIKLTALSNAVLSSTIGGAAVSLEATGVECKNCMAENRVTEGTMNVFGTGGTLTFKNVSVVGKPECTVFENSGGVMGPEKGIETEPLKIESQKTATNEVVLSNANAPTSTVLASFFITGPSCTFNSTTPYTVKGDVNGTTKGDVLTVNVPLGTTMKLGVNNASLSGKATIEAGTFHPAALT